MPSVHGWQACIGPGGEQLGWGLCTLCVALRRLVKVKFRGKGTLRRAGGQTVLRRAAARIHGQDRLDEEPSGRKALCNWQA